MAETQPRSVAYPGLFKATYYVDPTFTGLQAGSESNPFTTIAQAFAAAVALGLSGALIKIPPGSNVTESIVYPATGGSWEIACESEILTAATITGTITCTSTSVQLFARLRNIHLTGAVSGDSPNGINNFFIPIDCLLGSSVTLTATGLGFWVFQPIGATSDANSFGGAVGGASTITGSIHAIGYTFLGAISATTTGTVFLNCRIATGSITINPPSTATFGFFTCTFTTAVNFVGTAGTCVVQMDGTSFASLISNIGCQVSGAAPPTVQTRMGNFSSFVTIGANVSSTGLGARQPAGLYEMVFDMTLLAAGTSGTAQLNAIYTDMTGTLVTVPVGSGLLVTAAVGTKASGVLPFQHNGAAAIIAYSVTGITTGGSLSIALAVAIRRVS